MEPVTATVTAAKAGISLYEAGGFALLLLAVIVAGATLMARFLMALIRDLGTRLNAVQDQQTGLLVGVVQESTKASNELRAEVAKQTAIIENQTEVLSARPCLVDSATIRKPAAHRMQRHPRPSRGRPGGEPVRDRHGDRAWCRSGQGRRGDQGQRGRHHPCHGLHLCPGRQPHPGTDCTEGDPMKKYIAMAFWWTVAVLLILWPLGLVLGGEAKAAATAADWAADPDSALKAVLAQASSLAQLNVSAGTLGWILGGLGAAVAVLRCTPAWGPLIGLVWDIAAPKAIKLSEQQQAAQAQGFQVLVKTIERLPADSTLGELRDKMARKAPDVVKQTIENYLTQIGPQPTPLTAVAVTAEAPKA
jgi:hypothetical protein